MKEESLPLSQLIDSVAKSKECDQMISFKKREPATPTGRRFDSVEEMTNFYAEMDNILFKVKRAYLIGGHGWIGEMSKNLNMGIEELKDTTIPIEDGLDSLDILEFIMALESEFDIDIADNQAEMLNGKSLSFIAEIIYNHLNPSSNNTYNRGYICAFDDFLGGIDRHYLNGDENGADSKAHETYIVGYNMGWTSAQNIHPYKIISSPLMGRT